MMWIWLATKDAMGKYHKGIENYIPKAQYLTDDHQELRWLMI